MPIRFQCACGKKMQADDSLAGRMTRCPQCQAVLKIPRPRVDPDPSADVMPLAPAREPDDPWGGPAEYDLEPADEPPIPAMMPAAPPIHRPTRDTADFPPDAPASSGSIREYAYLLLGLALIPLVFSLLGKDESQSTIVDRIKATLQEATPDQLQRTSPSSRRTRV